MKILFLSRWFPYPVNNGSKLRINNLLHGLSRHHAVTLLTFADQPDVNPETPEMREICARVSVIPWKEFSPNTFRARLAILGIKPRSIVDTFSPEMAKAITDALSQENYDLIIASQLQMAAYYPYFQDVPAVFEEFEIGLFHDQAYTPGGRIRTRQVLTWLKLRMYLSRLLGSFRACTVASETEHRLLRENFPVYGNPVEVIPNCLDMEQYKNIRAEKKNNTLIFTGSFRYRANYDAMVWFVEQVFPLILNRLPDTQLIITGDPAGQVLPSLKNIILAGYVQDVKSLVASCSVSVAPLLSGGGTRLKILEAMALGTPVVSTAKGAEGLGAKPGEHLLISDNPQQFAGYVMDLLSGPDLQKSIAGNAEKFVMEKYDWQTVLPCFLDLLNRII